MVSITTIGVRTIASRAVTTKVEEVEKFDWRNNFLLWKMRVMTLLVNEGTHNALLGAEKKPSKMGDELVNLDVRVKITIIICLLDEVLYNVMNEETFAGLWCKLESLHDEFIQQTLLEEAVV